MTTIAFANTGAAGSIWIDDDGTYIRLYIQNRSSQTFTGGAPWSVSFSGIGNDGGTFAISGVQTIQVGGAYYIGYNQSVTFTMGATGTQGLGGPTSISANIGRATAPGAPGTPVASEVTPTSMRLTWTIPGNGGSAIDQMLLRRSSTPDFASYVDYAQGGGVTTAVVTALTPASTYYWRVFAHNGVGYSQPSGTLTQKTASGLRVGKIATFVDAETTLGKGSTFGPTQIFIGKGSSFVPLA